MISIHEILSVTCKTLIFISIKIEREYFVVLQINANRERFATRMSTLF